MAKAVKKELNVNSKNVDIKKVIANSSDASIVEKIATIYILDRSIANAKEKLSKYTEAQKGLINEVKGTPFAKIIESMVDEGFLDSADEKPVINIEMDADTTYQISMTGSTDDAFSISGDLKAPAILDTLDPKYTTTTVKVSLNEKTIKDEYKAGTLPPDLALYCSCSPADITKMTKKIVTKKEEE